MAQHTPGPWYESTTEGDNLHYIASDNRILACILHHRPGSADRIPHDETQEAKARLIAAAPSLLEALSAFVATADDYNGLPFDTEGTKALKRHAIQARAAIARARGEG